MATTNELNSLRTALSQDRTLFTVWRNSSRSNEVIRVDCFASKGAGSPGLVRITSLVAGVLNYRCSNRGLAINNGEDVSLNLVAALSEKLELDLKHERVC
ncbi:MAG: hypothetical protein HY846_06880 [Nitrosomonadales bacterium]|nr:hypothetical protein [Nitrosomonadales bacterium]